MKRVFRRWLQLGVCLGLAATVWAAEDVPADPALELYYSANGLYNRKLYPLAMDQYREFLAKHSGHPKAAMAELGLGLSLFMAGEMDEAEPLLAQLSTRKDLPDLDQVRLLHGQALLKLNRPEQAEKVFDAAMASAGNAAHRQNALAGLVEALYQAKGWEALVPRAAELLQAVPTGTLAERARYQLGLASFHVGDFAEAVETLKPFAAGLKASPYQVMGRFLLAEAYRSAGNLDEAAKEYAVVAGQDGQAVAVDARFLLGYTQFQRKAYDEAIKALKPFTDKFTDHASYPQGLILLGRSYLEKGRGREAAQILEKAFSQAGVAGEAALWLGRARLLEKQPDRAVEALSAGLGKAAGQPVLAALLFELGNLYLEREQFVEAAQSYDRLIREFREHPQRADAQRQRAYSLHRAKKFPDCVSQCDAFIQEYADHPTISEVLFLRAESLFLADRKTEAVQGFKTLVQSYPDHARADAARFRAGQVLYEQSQWAKAYQQLEPLLGKERKDPLFDQLGYLAGACCYNLEQWTKAGDYFEEFAVSHPRVTHADLALLTAAVARQKADDPEQAIRQLSRFPELFADSPLQPRAWSELGRLQYEQKQYDAARTTLQQVLKTKEADAYAADARYYLGWVELSTDRLAESAEHFGALADQHPDDERAADARFQQGWVWFNMDKYTDAETAFRALLTAFPQDERAGLARFQLGLTLARQEKWAPALEALGAVAVDLDQYPQALYESAWCAKALDQSDQAVAFYQALLKDYPGHDLAPSSAFELAELEYGQQQFKPAAERLEKILAGKLGTELVDRALFRLGWCYFDLNSPLKAAPVFERLIEEAPQSELLPSACFQAGESRLQLKEYPVARKHFERAVVEEQKSTLTEPTLLRLGETRGLTGDWAASEKSYDDFIRRFPASDFLARARFGLGWARENQKQYPQAVEAYRQVITAGVKDETAARCQFQIGECFLAQEQFDEAIVAFMGVEVNFAYPEYASKALLEMGVALERKGDPEAALERYREIVQKYPETEAADVARQALKQQVQ